MDGERFLSSFRTASEAFQHKFENGHLEPHLGLNFPFLIGGNIFYFVMLAVLYLIMRNRKPFMLTNFMRLYNLSCVVLAGSVCYGVIDNYIRYGTIYYVGNPDRLDARTDGGRHLLWYIWLYYIQKYWEFLDSFIFILRHKWNQLSFLHVYHHSSITIITCLFIVWSGSGDVVLGSFINSFIHVLMYSHYFLSTFKIQMWWKPYLTQMQLIQFVMVTIQALLSFMLDDQLGWPYFLRWVMLFYTISMIILFSRFYVQSYLSKPTAKKRDGKAGFETRDKDYKIDMPGMTVFGLRGGEKVERRLRTLYGYPSSRTNGDQITSTAEHTVKMDPSMRLLNDLHLPYNSFCHEHVSTVEAWRPHCERNSPGSLLCKNLFCKDKKKGILALVTALADTNVSLDVIQKHLGLKNMRLASTQTLYDALGLQAGAVSPLGLINDPEHSVNVFFDKNMLDSGHCTQLLIHPTSGNDTTLALHTNVLLAYVQKCGHVVHVVDFDRQEITKAD
eukprot:gene4170-6517_t